MVLENYCGHPIYDPKVSWDSPNPIFSLCLSDTLLLWIPSAIICLFGPISICRLIRCTQKSLPWTILLASKMVLTLCLVVVSFYELIATLVRLTGSRRIYPTDYMSPFIKLLSYVIASALLYLHKRKGVHTSIILSLFWFFMSLQTVINYWTILNTIQRPTELPWTVDRSDIVARSLETPCILSLFILNWFADTKRSPYSYNKDCPILRTSFFSQILFFWYDSMAYKGFKKALTEDDMWDLAENNKTVSINEEFGAYFDESIKVVPSSRSSSRKREIRINILVVLIKAFWPWLLISAIFKFFSSFLIFANPMLFDWLITFITFRENPWKGYLCALGMISASFTQAILESQYEFWIQTVAMRVRSALIATIYTKSLRLSSLGRKDYTTGEIVNLMSVDIQRIVDYVTIFNFIWSAPAQLIFTVYLLYRQLGVAALAGLAGMIILIPFNGFMTVMIKNIQTNLMKEKDARTKLLSEILNGIKVLKLYAWEGAFGDIVSDIRLKEVNLLKQQAIYIAGIFFAFGSAPFMVALLSFATYVLMNPANVLDANKAFVSLTLISILGGPLAFLPMVITWGANFFISIRRVNKYLREDELDLNSISHEVDINRPIKIQKSTFSWSRGEEPILKDIDLEVSKGKLVAIVGTIGAGKSSLLAALLGDLFKVCGYVNISGQIAYVPQTAWIQNATVRENILFGEKYLKDKYDRVIEACALESDFKILTGGDQTEIGEKGINLSGGQKQRISIARAVYSNSDVYLLDDPLSAVDAHVSKHLFEHVIGPKGLLKNKTRVLITHRITFLPQVDEIVVMRNGKIHESGTYPELMDKKGEFADFITQYLAQKKNELTDEDKALLDELKTTEADLDKALALNRSISQEKEILGSGGHSSSEIDISLPKNSCSENAKLVDAENVETGSVKWAVYLEYFKSIGVLTCVFILLLYTIANALSYGASRWLSAWTDDSLNPINYNNTRLRNKRLGVYAGLGLSESFITFIINMVQTLAFLTASKWLHETMLVRIVHAPMSFFDTTPLGRALNRFTKDIDTADFTLGFSMRMLLGLLFRTIVSAIVICSTTPYMIIAILIFSVLYVLVQKFYIASSRQLRRIESTTRSPIYSHFSETVNGATSIRAFSATDRFIKECFHRVDVNHSCSFPNIAANRWLSIRLELLGNLIVFFSAIAAVADQDNLTPGTASLSINYALQITGFLSALVRSVSDVETNIVSIERCLEYTKIPVEADWVIESHRPSPKWPDRGKIVFKDYSTRYRPGLDLILNDINCAIHPNTKVGIVGRTGAGKSSLTLALFRLIEPVNGSIIIDEQDISVLGLHDLRSRLTVIPQDPVLFSGSFRRNFDPFNRYTDTEIWKALEHAHLKEFVVSLEQGLNHEVAEGGENLSVGQRQLVCLTRALLRKSKILVLDEATAAVDVETDELIQQTIRQEFSDCTIVTIAHRLNTIMDYDKIIVMDKGKIIEYDSPNNLLKNTKSQFYSLAKEAKLV